MAFGWFKKDRQQQKQASEQASDEMLDIANNLSDSSDSNAGPSGKNLSINKVSAVSQSDRENGTVTQMDLDKAPEFVISHVHHKRKSHGLSFFSMVLNLVLFACLGLLALSGYALVKYSEKGPLKEDKIISVPRGAGLTAITNMLVQEGAIKDRRLFKAAVYAKKLQAKLRAGEYSIPAGASMKTILQTLSFGKTFSNKVTIPEGWTSYRVVQRLMKNQKLTGTIDEIPAEGSLLPDTYTFSTNEKRSQLIKRMQKAQEVFLAKAWANRGKDIQVKTPQEAVILASIVEKETGIAGERYLIAGVFSNRLRRKMRLQSDPTIIYGLVGGRGPLGRGLRRSEINQKTPYNTYQIPALPPTPIANPGREAIKAVLNPAKTKYIFFVANGTGGHTFAETNAEHVKNVRQWRKVEKEIRARQAARAAAREKEKKLEKLKQEAEQPRQPMTPPQPGTGKQAGDLSVLKVSDRLGQFQAGMVSAPKVQVKAPKPVGETGGSASIILLNTSVPVKNPRR